MGFYKKKPVVVEAKVFTKESAGIVASWVGKQATLTEEENHGLTLVIHTLEGDMVALPGDYIIQGVKGEFYPCREDIFLETYEPAPAEV